MRDEIQVFDSLGQAYHDAFSVFLAHTDQKVRAKEWLTRFVQNLKEREHFIDAGAGTGGTTAWLVPFFKRTTAIEPNTTLFEELKKACPTATLASKTILESQFKEKADLVLCSHVLYYIDSKQWTPIVSRMLEWLKKDGTLIILLQNPQTDCMKMFRHFQDKSFLLENVAKDLLKAKPGLKIKTEKVDSWIETKDEHSAYQIAEFVLNLVPFEKPVSKSQVMEYIRTHFKKAENHYRFSCHQDFMQIQA